MELASWCLQEATAQPDANLGKLLGLFLVGPQITDAGSSCQQPTGFPATKGPGEFSLRGHAVASASYLLFVPIALQLAFDRLRSL